MPISEAEAFGPTLSAKRKKAEELYQESFYYLN